jgi:hypothetical protein
VSFICTVANYEYGFFWHFYQASWILYTICTPIHIYANSDVGLVIKEKVFVAKCIILLWRLFYGPVELNALSWTRSIYISTIKLFHYLLCAVPINCRLYL